MEHRKGGGASPDIRSHLSSGAIDEYQLLVHPIVLGGGKRLFGEGGARTALRLVETKTFDSGVVLLTYQPAERQKGA